jgi:hypothetical protein
MAAQLAAAQEPAEAPIEPASTLANTVVTAHGVVKNAATGQPLPRALVRIEGDAETGALTDGDGRFEIPGLPVGPQAFQVLKPGFRDRPSAAGAAVVDDTSSPTHNVLLAPDMPDVIFTLTPTSSIHGQIELSTGDPAQGIEINLLERTVEDGRADWTPASITKTDSEGFYRFAGLTEGVYAIYTQPALDNESAVNPAQAGSGAREGYPSVFYPDARDVAGAAHIQLSSGEEMQANLTLTLEPFRSVSATLAQSQSFAPSPAGASYNAVVMDAAGHQLPYPAIYASRTHAVQALLPDGTYSLQVSSATATTGGSPARGAQPLSGSVEFSVAGHEVTNLRVSLAVPHPNPVELSIVRTAPPQTGAAQSSGGETMVVMSQAGNRNDGQNEGQNESWIGEGMVTAYAHGSEPGSLPAIWLLPGFYWVHTHIGQKGLCEASFTAGGVNVAREPVAIGLNGSAAPMALTLRDDCAALTLSLPPSLDELAPGEEPFYTVYVVPDFDSTVDLEPVTLRPSTGGTATLNDLTPGSYHVYAFNAPVRLEYHNPATLAELASQSQAVTLTPGTTSEVVLEVLGQ